MKHILPKDSIWAAEDIAGWLSENSEALSASFQKAFVAALAQFRTGSRRKDLGYIYISFLRSAVLTGLPWLQVDLYGAGNRMDPRECSSKWEIEAPFTYRAPYHNDIAGHEINAVLEREALLLENAEMFFQGLSQFMTCIVGDARNNLSLPHVRWYYGEYLGEVKEIG